MKITKFLPLALALAFVTTCPSFAEPDNGNGSATGANTTLSFTLAEHVYISVAKNAYTATAAVDNEYTTLTLDPMSPVFTVYTNTPGQEVYIYAKTGSSDEGDVNALYKRGNNGYAIAFANTATNHIPTDAQIATLTGGNAPSGVADNPNVIGVSVGHAITYPTGLSGTPGSATESTNEISYALQEGTYIFTFTTGETQMPNTFSTHDSAGTYQATLYMATTSGA